MTTPINTNKVAKDPDWARHHNQACDNPKGVEVIVTMLMGWKVYAKAHKQRYESVIGEDYILGKAWIDMGKAFITLLNGELARLDAGTLNAFIRKVATENGFTEELELPKS